jgi:hypothetical protein
MNGSVVDLFAQRGNLVAKEVSPWQTFSGKGMKFQLQSYDWDDCACVSYLTMRAFLGLMKMETLICTPYTKDLPIYSYDKIIAFGKKSLLLEVYDTQVEPVDLSSMDAVKESYKDLKDKQPKPAWYDSLRLSPSIFKEGKEERLVQLATAMTTAYLDLFATAREVDRAVKTERNRTYVEGLISNGGPAINAVRGMIGDEAAETLFRRFLFGTE